jgi:hypothetical protein
LLTSGLNLLHVALDTVSRALLAEQRELAGPPFRPWRTGG